MGVGGQVQVLPGQRQLQTEAAMLPPKQRSFKGFFQGANIRLKLRCASALLWEGRDYKAAITFHYSWAFAQ